MDKTTFSFARIDYFVEGQIQVIGSGKMIDISK